MPSKHLFVDCVVHDNGELNFFETAKEYGSIKIEDLGSRESFRTQSDNVVEDNERPRV